jgi:hypothetical protein
MTDRFDELDGTLLRGLAPVARIYFVALCDEGFTEEQALVLTSAWQTSWLGAERGQTRRRGGTPT